jgi:hypothetical protein
MTVAELDGIYGFTGLGDGKQDRSNVKDSA